MIGFARDDDALVASMMHGHSDGQIIGLGAGAGEHGMAQFGVKCAQQILSKIKDFILDIAGMGAQRIKLAFDRLGHARV